MKIVLAEDSSTMRKILLKILNGLGHVDVCEAADGVQALKRLSEDEFDLLITDWDMPNMSGLQLIKEVRANPDTVDVPIIVSTSRSSQDEVVEAMGAGANDFISKPFNDVELQAKIESVLKSVNVLIAEDSTSMMGVLKKMLEDMGYSNVYEANDGAKAWEILCEGRFDLLITDWNMPNMSGLELVEHVRADHSMVDMPIIMSTSRTNHQDVIEAMKSGVTNYISKPFRPNQLRDKIAQVMRGQANRKIKKQLFSVDAMLKGSARDMLYDRRFPFVLLVEKSIELSELNLPVNRLSVERLRTKVQAIEIANSEIGGDVSYVLADNTSDVLRMVDVHAADIRLVMISDDRPGGGVTLANQIKRNHGGQCTIWLFVESTHKFPVREREAMDRVGIRLIENSRCTPRQIDRLLRENVFSS